MGRGRSTRVWFNRWFSSAFNVVRLLRAGCPSPLWIHVTHDDPTSLVLQCADHASLEPRVDGSTYLDYALEYCAEHEIEVFWPGRDTLEFTVRQDAFEAQGTRLMVCSDPVQLRRLNDKAETYAYLDGDARIPTPAHSIVNTVDEFKAAVGALSDEGIKVCFKPTVGTGGAGFRILELGRREIDAIFKRPSLHISFDQAVAALSQVERFPDLIVSEYLDGPEYSIDCLGSEGTLLAAVPRRRMGGRVQQIDDNPAMVEVARAACERFNLSYLFNVQVRVGRGTPKLIEVNPRMAAGINVSCLSGINLPAAALTLMLAGEVAVPELKFGGIVGRIDEAVILNPIPEHTGSPPSP